MTKYKNLNVAKMKRVLNRSLLMKTEQTEAGIFHGYPFARRKYILHYNSRVSSIHLIYYFIFIENLFLTTFCYYSFFHKVRLYVFAMVQSFWLLCGSKFTSELWVRMKPTLLLFVWMFPSSASVVVYHAVKIVRISIMWIKNRCVTISISVLSD